MNPLKFRRVKDTDIWDIYEISNDPVVRSFSFSQKPIGREEHLKWFQKVDKRFFFVAEVDNRVVGQIRFDKKKRRPLRGIHKRPPLWRGKGIGRFILREGLKELLKGVKNAEVIARVREENIASRHLFEKEGFEELKREKGIITYRYGERGK